MERDNEPVNTHNNASELEEEEMIPGASSQPPQFKLTAKMHNTNSSPYENSGINDVGNRFAFGKSADSTDEKNIT
jgi:hypothetical protein